MKQLCITILKAMQKDDKPPNKKSQTSTIIQSNAQKPATNCKAGERGKSKKSKSTLDTQALELLRTYLNKAVQQQALNDQDQYTARTNFVKAKVTPLNHKDVPLYKEILQESLSKQYSQNPNKRQEELLKSVKTYTEIMKIYRDCSVNPVIVMANYQLYRQLWMRLIKEQKSSLIFDVWKYIPHLCLEDFLIEFQLMDLYHNISSKEFFTFVSTGLFENKIQQYCQYYRLYKGGRSELSEQQKQEFNSFEYEQIIPRISKKDQLFTEFVINFIKRDRLIADKVLEGLDQKQYEKVIHLTGEDVRNHPRIIKFVMKKHFKDIARKKTEWFIIEDKLSFCQQFIQWFADSIAKKFKLPEVPKSQGQESDSQQIPMCYGISSQKEAEQVRQSILFRAGIIKQTNASYLENPLYEKDDYIPAQFIISNTSQFDKESCLTLQYFKFTKDNIIIIDSINEHFDKANKHLLSSQIVGFDSQFWATTTKYEQGGISIIQLSLKQVCYIFDYRNLRNCGQFDAFFIQLMEKKDIVKVGHTVSSDVQYLYKTFKKKINFRSFVDLVKVKSILYPNDVFSSLAYMCEKFLGKKMCKYEQRGNWNRRPLKKTQICYASLDALVCTAVLQKMMSQKKFNLDEISHLEKQKISEQNDEEETIQDNMVKKTSESSKIEPEFDHQKFKEYLVNPIFLVDNMLKKLCSTMRNCGIDTDFISIKDYDLAVSQVLKEKRILITRDSKLLSKRHINVPIYLLKQRSDIDIMFKEITDAFRLDLSQYKTLSRCVKCNSPELIVIPGEQAKKEVSFIYEDSEITQFWRCGRCKQIYWEGGQFKKAKDKYEQLRK